MCINSSTSNIKSRSIATSYVNILAVSFTGKNLMDDTRCPSWGGLLRRTNRARRAGKAELRTTLRASESSRLATRTASASTVCTSTWHRYVDIKRIKPGYLLEEHRKRCQYRTSTIKGQPQNFAYGCGRFNRGYGVFTSEVDSFFFLR